MRVSWNSLRAPRLLEVVRFLLVGGVATVISVIGFNALVHGVLVSGAPLAEHPISAYVLVNLVAGFVAYLGMRLWAFSHRGASDELSSVATFFSLGAATMLIPVLCLFASRHLLGMASPLADNISANVVGLGLGTAARYWVFRRYVFVDAGEPASIPAPRNT